MTKIGESSFADRTLTFPQVKPKAVVTDNKNLIVGTPSYNNNSNYTGGGKVANTEFNPQDPGLQFKDTDKIKIDNLKVEVTDIDGIDTNSKYDLKAKLVGNVKFSRNYVESLGPQLSQQMNTEIKNWLSQQSNTALIAIGAAMMIHNPSISQGAIAAAFSGGAEAVAEYLVNSLGLNISIQKNTQSDQYNITLTAFNGSIDIVKSDLNFTNGGIVVNNRLGDGLNTALNILSPLGSYLINPNSRLSSLIASQLNSNLGLKSVPYGNNSFKLVPELNNNNPIKNLPITQGNFNLSLDELDQGNTKTRFSLDNFGNIVMDIDAVAYGSSKRDGNLASPEDQNDQLTGIVDMAYRDDGSIDVKSDSSVKINIRQDEKDGIRQQLGAFGINAAASGSVTVDDLKTSLNYKQGQKLTYQASGKIVAKDLDVDFGGNKIQLSGDGNLSFENRPNGGYAIITNNSNVNGNTSINNEQYSMVVENLKAKGEMEYIPAVPNKTSDIYKINGTTINAKGLGLKFDNNWIAANNLIIKAGSAIINPTDKSMELTGASVKVDNFRFMDQNKNPSFNLTGTFSNNSKNSSVKYNNGNFNISGTSNIQSLDYQGSKFSGNVNGTVSGNGKDGNLKISGIVSNFTGNLQGHDIKELDLNGKISTDSNGNMKVDAKTLKLNIDKSEIQGSELVVNKQGNILKINDNKSDDTKVSNNKNPKEKKAPKDIPATLTISQDNKKLISDLKFEGTIEYDTANNTLKFNDPKDPLIIKGGSISDVKFTNFKPKGEIAINGDNITLKSPSSFDGTVSYGNLSISDAKITAGSNGGNGDLTFNSADKSVAFNGDASLNLIDAKNKKTIPLSFKGDIQLKQEGNLITVNSKDGLISGKLGNTELKDFKFTGQLIYNQQTGEINLKKIDEQTPVSFKGNMNGLDIDLNSNQGNISIIKDKEGNYVINADKVDLQGKVANIDVKTEGNGLSGKITIDKNGNPNIENLDASIDVEGIKFKTKGDAVKKDNGYEINLSQVNLSSDKTKVATLIDKIKDSPFAKNKPETIKKLNELKNLVSQLNVKTLEAQDLKISFDKDFNYSLSGTATNVDLSFSDIPERSVDLKNTPPNKISFSFDSKGNSSVSSDGSTINAKINGIQFQDFKMAGTVNFSKEGKTDFTGNAGLKNIDISGNIIFDSNGKTVNRKLDLKAESNIAMTKTGNDLEFQSDNMKVDGMFSGFNVKSNPTGTPPTYASGKFTVKEDGHIDVSKLNFDFNVDGIQIANKNGSFTSTAVDPNNPGKREYAIKLDGNVDTNIKSFTDFLAKIGNDSITPDSAKTSINDTLGRLNTFLKSNEQSKVQFDNSQSEVKGNYQIDLTLDENFSIKSFSNTSTAVVKNVLVNTESIGGKKPLVVDQIEISAKSEIVKSSENGVAGVEDKNTLYVKEGEIKLPITENLKNSVMDMIKDIAIEGSKPKTEEQQNDKSAFKWEIKEEDLKDLKIDVSDSGAITLGGSIRGIPIVGKMNIETQLKVDGTIATMQINKAKLGGIFGFVQSLASLGGLSVKNEITEKAVQNFYDKQGIKADYSGKNAFTFNLQDVIDNNMSSNIKLDDVKIDSKNITVKYNASYGEDNKFNFNSVNAVKEKFNQLENLNPKKDKKVIKELLDDINLDLNKLSAKEVSLVFDRVALKDKILDTLKDNDDKVLNLLKTLTSKISIDPEKGDKSNINHIKRFIKAAYIETNGKVSITNKTFKEALIDFDKYINANPTTVSPELKAYVNQEVQKIRKA